MDIGGDLDLQNYSVLSDDWLVDHGSGTFESPDPVPDRPEQMLMFAPRLRNGSIAAEITPISADKSSRGFTSLEAALVFRYGGPESFYYAGCSAFDARFFMAKAVPGRYFVERGVTGRRSSVQANRTYRLRVDFNGSQITLFDNDVPLFTVLDDAYSGGQIGFRTFRTKAIFSKVTVRPAVPRCFVVMPFASELNFVYGVIKSLVEEFGISCERADEVYLSRPVMDDVKVRIAEADLVIVDFTGRNPNVYYEAGLADAFKKDWIVLAQSSEDMTFDVRHIRSIRYSNAMGADIKLRDDLRQALQGLGHRLPIAAR